MYSLKDKVAVIAEATRGAGNSIACMLRGAGTTVYCTGRNVEGKPSPINRIETIEETTEMVTTRGGIGIWAQVKLRDAGVIISSGPQGTNFRSSLRTCWTS